MSVFYHRVRRRLRRAWRRVQWFPLGRPAVAHASTTSPAAPARPHPVVLRPVWRMRRVLVAGLASMIVHEAAIVALALCQYSLPPFDDTPPLVEAHFAVEPEVVEPPAEAEVELEIARPDDIPAESIFAANAMSVGEIESTEPEVESDIRTVDEELAMEVLSVPDEAEAFVEDENLVAAGSVGEEVREVEGAVDRISHEIIGHLERGKVLVVWLMDASLSLKEERGAVADRLEQIYSELGQLSDLPEDAMTSAVIAYGSGAAELVKPTSDVAAVLDGIRNVPVDQTGVENVFSTVVESIDRYRTQRSRQHRKMLLVVWTDESGDDYARLDEAVNLCKRLESPVYVVGPSAMFGREDGVQAFVHSDGKTYQLPVDRGPDSVRQEEIALPFWFGGGQLNSIRCGLGPYALVRLSQESGGAYFIQETARDRSPFTLDTMRRYAPEYCSVGEYVREAADSRLRTAILSAVDLTLNSKLKGTPVLRFAPTAENFQDQLREAQETVAHDQFIIDRALEFFGKNGLPEEYEAETSPRWRAWYDLTYGRLLAARVRCYEYNFACSVMRGKGTEFVEQQSNRWEYRPSPQVRSGSQAERWSATALEHLNRCLTEHAGTPWAVLAERELRFPLGLEVVEGFEPPPPPPQERPRNGNPQPAPMRQPPRGRRSEKPNMIPREVPPDLPKL